MAISHILQESLDDRGGNHIAYILGHHAAEALESHSNNTVVLNDRSAAVAWIDGGVDLNHQMGVHARMGISPVIDARHYAPGYGKPVTAYGITQHRNGGIQGRHLTKLQRRRTFEKAFIHHLQHGQIAIVGDELDMGFVAPGISLFFEADETRIADHMGVGDNATLGNDKARAPALAGSARIPRHEIIGRLGHGVYTNHTAAKRFDPIACQRSGCGCMPKHQRKGPHERQTISR